MELERISSENRLCKCGCGNKIKITRDHIHKSYIPEYIAGHNHVSRVGNKNSMYGKHHSIKTRKKISRAVSGKNHWNYKGGEQYLNNNIRASTAYREWRFLVFKRDNFTCQDCGKIGYVEAHHIIPLSEIMSKNDVKSIWDAHNCEQIWDIDNGITYCKHCHAKADKRRAIALCLL